MLSEKKDSLINNDNYTPQSNNEILSNNKISTNRLINESILLNSKVEKYRQALSMNSASLNNFQLSNDNININNSTIYNNSMLASKGQNQNINNSNSIFHPQYNINTLGSLSKEFISISKKPEEIKELFKQQNNINNINSNIYNNENNKNNNFISKNYFNNLMQSYENHIIDLYTNFKFCLNKLEEIACLYGNKITGNVIKDAINDNLFFQKEKQIRNFINCFS